MTAVHPERRDEATGDPALASLTVVIANWQTADYTIRSVRALTGDGVPAARIVVVDNGSTDGSYERFREEIPACVLVRVEENIGFARASNLGARTVPGESYLFVNSDAFLHRPGSVRRLLAALDDPHVGIAVPRVLNVDLSLQPNVVPSTTPVVALVRASGLSRFIPNRWQPSWSTHWDHASSREIHAADGAVVLVRGETWYELGGFDERMRMYVEDLDLCLRARRAGWKIWFVHEAEFVHVGRGATATTWDSPRRAELIGLAEGDWIRRTMTPRAARATLAFMSAGLVGRILVFGALRNRDATDALRASLRGYRGSARPPTG
jgi:N-acetylglucosaminyl-diphospho-decaprenol L-rhamnosyltransferase